MKLPRICTVSKFEKRERNCMRCGYADARRLMPRGRFRDLRWAFVEKEALRSIKADCESESRNVSRFRTSLATDRLEFVGIQIAI